MFLVGVVSEVLASARVDVVVEVALVEVEFGLTATEFEGSFVLASEDLEVDVAETALVLCFVWFVFSVLFLFPPLVHVQYNRCTCTRSLR